MSELSDLEITKACFDAMGLVQEWKSFEPAYFDPGLGEWGSVVRYAPLTDDAQAMALVKRFDFVIERELISKKSRGQDWGVTLFDRVGKVHTVRHEPDLNRAICLCIARMKGATEGGE